MEFPSPKEPLLCLCLPCCP
ncbi:hypothetical protein MTR67_018554 [Solanum verrucosum]|uniref:Uncharacterized protein n=1 Tax=Solanum verrucosum TaxID=315347 RepID=A0AAF0QJW8_SOLVR|nr:hypothetical protein MTR67_018554 [Solanum verrucosum]